MLLKLSDKELELNCLNNTFKLRKNW